MKNTDSKSHLQGKSIYIDDIPEIQGTLHALVVGSEYAHAKILSADFSKAEQAEGIVKILTYKDIPGENQIGAIVQDEPLFAENEVHYKLQPIALIVAESVEKAKEAKSLIEIKYKELEPVTDVETAKKNESFIIPPRTFSLGSISEGETKSDYIFEGFAENGGQEHLYLETQASYAVPKENGNILLYSSTQGPTAVQKLTAKVLGLAMNKIEVDVNRLGGGFGGKEDQATPWAVMSSLATFILQKPVKLVLDRHTDMGITGKRHPYKAKYKIGLSKDFKIKSYKVEFLQDAGAAADLSPAILERTLFHATGSYFIPNTEITVFCCRTNLPPNTAFRGFGAPQGMFAIESAISHAAEKLGVKTHDIQKVNLLKEGDEFSYGQIAEKAEAHKSWIAADNTYNIQNIEKDISSFNSSNENYKKGFSVIPLCFGISFTNTVMNHARALVHIYQDGSIGISTGAIEMGQGVNTKMLQAAQNVFSVNPDRIKLETTNTTRVANTSPTAASSGADLNGKAVEIACNELLGRLKKAAGDILNESPENIILKKEFVYVGSNKTEINWETLVEKAFLKRVKLSEKGHYATPKIYFDKTKEKGHPFSYHVYGTAVTIVKIDTIRGTYEVEAVKIIHDFGKSMNIFLDKGQVEGALIQGIGWVTMEEIKYDKTGRNLAGALSTYKIPDLYFTPKEVEIIALESEGHENAVLKSKAVGEPPFIYGMGTYFALINAIKSFNTNYKAEYSIPMTHEKLLMSLYQA